MGTEAERRIRLAREGTQYLGETAEGAARRRARPPAHLPAAVRDWERAHPGERQQPSVDFTKVNFADTSIPEDVRVAAGKAKLAKMLADDAADKKRRNIPTE